MLLARFIGMVAQPVASLAHGLAGIVAEARALGGGPAETSMAAYLAALSCCAASISAARKALYPLAQALDSRAPGGDALLADQVRRTALVISDCTLPCDCIYFLSPHSSYKPLFIHAGRLCPGCGGPVGLGWRAERAHHVLDGRRTSAQPAA